MRQAIQEGLNLAEQLAALPFKTARQLLRDTSMNQRPLGDVVQESLQIGEDLARLPFKATAALLTEVTQSRPSLEQRVAELERRLGVQSGTEPGAQPEPPPAG